MTKLHSRMLKDCGVKDEDGESCGWLLPNCGISTSPANPSTPVTIATAALYHFCRGIAVVPSSDHLLVGTSWGEILVTSCTASASKPGLGVKQPLTPANFVTLESMNKGHKQAITAIVADERCVSAHPTVRMQPSCWVIHHLTHPSSSAVCGCCTTFAGTSRPRTTPVLSFNGR